MKTKWMFLVAIAGLFAMPATAQDAWPRVAVAVDYSYFRFNPAIPQLRNPSFNGGGGSVDFNLSKVFGIKSEFVGYLSTTWTGTFPVLVVTPHGTVPAGTYHSDGNMFTYLFGPTLNYRTSRVNYYGEMLFGGSGSNGYVNLVKAIDAGGGTVTASGTQHPFTMAIGGGIDIHFTKHFAFRPVEIDYVLTRYSNPISGVNNQNHFRYLAGVVFTFGER